MIRVTLDTNVIVAGFVIRTGLPARVLNLWLTEQFQLITSGHIVDEASKAWAKEYWSARFTQKDMEDALEFLAEVASPITVVVEGVATRWHDDKVLATAVSGSADYLVTGDKELRAVGECQGVKIRTPQEFLAEFEDLTSG